MKQLLLFTFVLTSIILNAQRNLPWQQQSGDLPPARANHSMVVIDSNVYLFGGEDSGKGNSLNDLWKYDEGNSTWEEKTPANPPSPRKYHAAVEKNSKMYVFGGDSNGITMDDIWEYNPETNAWVEKPSASSQNPKLFFSATAGDSKIWITGGIDFTTNEATPATWGYDLATGTWTQVADCPSPRYGHAAFYKDGKLVICAGRRLNDLLDDMWSYDVATDEWHEIVPVGTPVGVKFPAYDYNSEVLWMAGGTNVDQSGNYVDSKSNWEYNFAGNSWEQKADGPEFTFGAGVILHSNNKGDNSRSDYEAMTFGGMRAGEIIDESWIYYSVWDTIVGLPENEGAAIHNNVKIFPSVTTGEVTINSEKKIQRIMIYNIQGQLIQNKEVACTELKINLLGNNPGKYFINVYFERSFSTFKVILR